MGVAGVEAAKARQKLTCADLKACGQGQSGGVGFFHLDTKLREDDVAFKAKEGINAVFDVEFKLLKREACLVGIVCSGLERIVTEGRGSHIKDDGHVGVAAGTHAPTRVESGA